MMENAIAENGLTTEIVVFGNTTKHTSFSDFVQETGTEDQFEPVVVDDLYETAIIFFSSGTTGLPKGICTTHYGLLVQNEFLGYIYFYFEKGVVIMCDNIFVIRRLHRDNNVCLYYTTLYWISGVILLTMTILFGTTRIIARKFDEATAMKYVEDYKVQDNYLF